jgi:hypothetical protein
MFAQMGVKGRFRALMGRNYARILEHCAHYYRIPHLIVAFPVAGGDMTDETDWDVPTEPIVVPQHRIRAALRDANNSRFDSALQGGLWLIALVFFPVTLYFLPTIIAYNRNHPQGTPLFIINLLLGWTVIAWVLCLAWSVWEFDRRHRR